jgi:hypothetical protein
VPGPNIDPCHKITLLQAKNRGLIGEGVGGAEDAWDLPARGKRADVTLRLVGSLWARQFPPVIYCVYVGTI